MATKLELNHLDHKLYSVIKQIRVQKRVDVNSIHKEIAKVIPFESVSTEFFNDRIEMLLQNDKIINRLNRNKNSFRLNEGLLDLPLQIYFLLPKNLHRIHIPHYLLEHQIKPLSLI